MLIEFEFCTSFNIIHTHECFCWKQVNLIYKYVRVCRSVVFEKKEKKKLNYIYLLIYMLFVKNLNYINARIPILFFLER